MKTFKVQRWAVAGKEISVDTEITVNSKNYAAALSQARAVNPRLIHRSLGINLYEDQNGWQYGVTRA